MFHFLVYCVKLLTYCLAYALAAPPVRRLAYTSGAAGPASCLCLPMPACLLPLASGCLHTCSLPKPRTSTVVAILCPTSLVAHLLSTDVYAKCHILYLSCLNCSSFTYFYTMAAIPPLLLNLTSFHNFFLLNFSFCTQDGAIYN